MAIYTTNISWIVNNTLATGNPPEDRFKTPPDGSFNKPLYELFQNTVFLNDFLNDNYYQRNELQGSISEDLINWNKIFNKPELLDSTNHNHDDLYYNRTEVLILMNTIPTETQYEVDQFSPYIHWDNLINVPSFGEPTSQGFTSSGSFTPIPGIVTYLVYILGGTSSSTTANLPEGSVTAIAGEDVQVVTNINTSAPVNLTVGSGGGVIFKWSQS